MIYVALNSIYCYIYIYLISVLVFIVARVWCGGLFCVECVGDSLSRLLTADVATRYRWSTISNIIIQSKQCEERRSPITPIRLNILLRVSESPPMRNGAGKFYFLIHLNIYSFENNFIFTRFQEILLC